MKTGSWITWLHSELLTGCCLYVIMGSSGDCGFPPSGVGVPEEMVAVSRWWCSGVGLGDCVF